MNISRSIFLVDDDADDQEIFIDALREVDANVHCHTSNDGIDALRKLAEGLQPDLIFLDLNMPRVNGKQVLKEMKSTEGVLHIPVIIYTTSNAREDIDTTLQLGASHYITKPSRFEELCNTLRDVLAGNWQTETKAPVC